MESAIVLAIDRPRSRWCKRRRRHQCTPRVTNSGVGARGKRCENDGSSVIQRQSGVCTRKSSGKATATAHGRGSLNFVDSARSTKLADSSRARQTRKRLRDSHRAKTCVFSAVLDAVLLQFPRVEKIPLENSCGSRIIQTRLTFHSCSEFSVLSRRVNIYTRD